MDSKRIQCSAGPNPYNYVSKPAYSLSKNGQTVQGISRFTARPPSFLREGFMPWFLDSHMCAGEMSNNDTEPARWRCTHLSYAFHGDGSMWVVEHLAPLICVFRFKWRQLPASSACFTPTKFRRHNRAEHVQPLRYVAMYSTYLWHTWRRSTVQVSGALWFPNPVGLQRHATRRPLSVGALRHTFSADLLFQI